MSEERRKYKRVIADFAVSVNDFDASHISEAKNLSVSGLCFQTSREIKVMKKVIVTLFLPIQNKDKPNFVKISCCGVVVRSELAKDKSRSYEISIYFVDMTKQDEKIIRKHVEYAESKSNG